MVDFAHSLTGLEGSWKAMMGLPNNFRMFASPWGIVMRKQNQSIYEAMVLCRGYRLEVGYYDCPIDAMTAVEEHYEKFERSSTCQDYCKEQFVMKLV